MMINKVGLGSTQLALQLALTLACPLLLTWLPVSAQAQAGESPEARLRRLETELRAVQRRVFPEGAGKSFGPEIGSPSTTAAAAQQPAATVVSDLLARMDTVEAQLQRMTAAHEEQ